MTCIGNSGPLPDAVVTAIEQADLVAVGVLSGNRNFEGRINPHTRANYLASPPLCIAYAIAGTVLIDFEKEPLGNYMHDRITMYAVFCSLVFSVAQLCSTCTISVHFHYRREVDIDPCAHDISYTTWLLGI